LLRGTDEILPIPGVTDDFADFHDSVLRIDKSSLRTMPFERAEDSQLYLAVADMCEVLGVKLAKMHEEIGGGFMECCIEAGRELEPVDQLIMLRNFLKVLAVRREQTITYMPRWSEEADSQSSHIHMSLLDNKGKPLFYDDSNEYGMSETFQYFVGGLQRYLPNMMLISAPTVNSWRRFVEGTFAPPAFTWGFENRTTAFRVVGEGINSLRVENRLPCSDANPYLVTASMLAAGLSGIEEKLTPTTPTVGNGYIPGTGEGEPLAADMKAAIDALASSQHARKFLGDQFVDAYVSTRSAQLESFEDKTLIDERKRFFELG